MEPNPDAVTVFTLGKTPAGEVVIVAASVPLVDATSNADEDYSREISNAEKHLCELAYTVYGSFLSTDRAATLVDLDACPRIGK